MVPQEKLDQLFADGWCAIEGVLTPDEADAARAALWDAVETDRKNGGSPWVPGLDPNRQNIRVFNLIDYDPVFTDLVQHPTALALVEALLGEAFSISNFTANIALPGAGSMAVHSDQSLVAPEPWVQPWSINIIWCLTDASAANGATRFLPGSQAFQTAAEAPRDDRLMRAFEAPKGSIIAMDGRVWHTSGANITEDQERSLLFGYYARAFLRSQQNWTASLAPETVARLSPQMLGWLGVETKGNRNLAKFLFDKAPADAAP